MEFRVLGPLEALSDGRALDLGGQKQRALLAVLLLDANRVVARERLIDALWEDDPPETARKALQVYVSQLRKTLGSGRVLTKAPGYLLGVDGDDELDLERFRRLRAEGRLEEALALWRGPPLAGLEHLRFAQAEIARLEEQRLACLEERIERDLAAGRHTDVVGELEALVREHPLRERLHGQLMLALYRCGRQAEALAAYQDARRILVEQLGIEPRRELRELEHAILRQDPAIDAAPATGDAQENARSAFVGREAELAELVAGLDDAFAGRGRLFLLVGEPGIGKSRLAEELVTRARARGATILVGRCWEAGGAPAYWPWLESLRAYVRESDTEALRSQLGTGASTLAQILPELRQRFPDLPEPPASEPDGARFRLFEAATDLLRAASGKRPLVLVLDDLHAADMPSLLLLQFLARQLGSSRVLVVGALRDVDPTPGRHLTELQAELLREPVTRRLHLRGMSEREVAEYVELSAAEIASPELVGALYEETEGNPLFLAETVRLLALEGLQRDQDGVRIAIPQGVRDVIARRLAHLSEECNHVLVLASVLGREFGLRALARLDRVSDDELLETVEEAFDARVVSDVPGAPSRLRFAHVVIRDTLYDGLTAVRRVRLHRLALQTLAELYGPDPGAHMAELAHHAIAGSDFDKGLDYARRAGDRALALFAYEEAARLYQTALEAFELAGPQDERSRLELLLALGEAHSRAGDMPSAKPVFLEAAELARRLGLPGELARAAAGYGGRIVFERGWGDKRLVPLLEEALSALGTQDDQLRARLLARLAGALRDEHSPARRDAVSTEAIELARRSQDPAALAYALDGRASAILAPKAISECLALGTELLELAVRVHDREHVVHAHNHRFAAFLLLGDVVRAQAELDAALPVAEELRQPAQLWMQSAARAMLALAAGRVSDADELARTAFAFGERAQLMAHSVYWLQRYALCDYRGGFDEVEPGLRELAESNPTRPILRCALAHLHARLGWIDQARAEFHELATDEFAVLPFDMEWLYAVSMLVETCAALGERRAAAHLYRQLGPWSALVVVDMMEGIRGSVSRYLGILAAAMERHDQACDHFEEALAANERIGARPWLAKTQWDYAQTLLAREGPGDRDRAGELLGRAEATYRELGLGVTP